MLAVLHIKPLLNGYRAERDVYTCVLRSALPTAPDLTLENCILPPASDTLNAESARDAME